jgi:peroxiredoxin
MPEPEQTPSNDAPREDKPPTRSTRWQRWRRPALEAFGLVIVLVAVRAFQSRSLVSGVAPSIVARSLDGAEVRLGAAAQRPQVLWFFATWCTVCRASEHNVRALGSGSDVVLIASDSGSDAAIARFVREQGLSGLVVVNDADGSVARRFGVRSFPTTFALGRDGAIRSTDIGYTTELGLRWRRFWSRQ